MCDMSGWWKRLQEKEDWVGLEELKDCQCGPCSSTSGILTYYEILAILEGTSPTKRSTITTIHDKTDAVNYVTFDDNQWVSYDDAVTFGQKLDWANDVGIGGAMIWASELGT